jgi:dihydrofolate synthase/folylpolyglutamate synthase
MNYSESEEYLTSLGNEVDTMKLGLENIRKLLRALGDPQREYFKVQVAGTNGKGSVCAFLDSICGTAGLSTGKFTSPHLVSITERIRINGAPISEEAFARSATRVREVIEEAIRKGDLDCTPTFFEQITAIALIAFADAGVEVAILETGLGGRLDATTAADAEIAAITRIDLDHQQYLGDTIEQIAAEKAAIIGPQTRSAIIGAQCPEALQVIRARFELVANPDSKLVIADLGPTPALGLRGAHQIENARVAIAVATQLAGKFPVNIDHIEFGLKNARHPGRLEYSGRYIFDGAHNPGGVRALAAYLDQFEPGPFTLVYGAMNDKSVAEMAELLFPRAETIILTKPSNRRSLTAGEIRIRAGWSENVIETDSVKEAVAAAEALANERILVTGSLYLIGEVKQLIENRS